MTLLQTEPYARAIIEAFRPGDSPAEIDRRVAVRMERQNRLAEDKSLRLAVVLSESVTQQLVGTPETTADQLRRLTRPSPNIMVQVLPLRCGAHPALMGSFSIVSFPLPTDPDVVYLENMASALYVEDAAEVHKYADVFDRLRAMAPSPSDSSDLLLKAAASLA